ncbi:MAG TPA: ferrous iron transporter B [Vicinamibacterales bacterium]|nr:ferrous iron transporter B [Vicinamibacterales bacterium]
MPCPMIPDATISSRRAPLLRLRSHPLRIALVGNPNVGKSVVFGRLTGRYATVSNYPGTTVTMTTGRALIGAEVCDVIDTPGMNTLEGALSEDERITKRLLATGGAELIVQVADARNLRRALMLTSQLADTRLPMILVLNMVDEADARGITIDTTGLSEHLGIPVIEAVAPDGRGIAELRDALTSATRVLGNRSASVSHVDWASSTAAKFRRMNVVSASRVREAINRAVREPLTGLPILALVLYATYLFVGVFGAQTLVGALEEGVFDGFINPAATIVAGYIPVPLIRDFLVGNYGLITMGLTYAMAIVLPVVTTFFLMFGFLEDSGYIPRLAIFSDRLFRSMGLNGKAVLPMVLGLGCDTMATMTTRILGTPKERLIAITLLALGVPCSAQLATIMGILGGISLWALVLLFGVVLSQMVVVGFLAARALPGDRSDFILELPPIRLPRMGNLATKTALRVRWYLGEAVPLFLVGTALLFVLDRIGALDLLTSATRPLVTGALGLPSESAGVFVMGFLRRDYGAAGLFKMAHDGSLTAVQSVIALTVMTLFVPCVANLLMIVRERGVRTGMAILAAVTVIAIGTGAVLNFALTMLRITF